MLACNEKVVNEKGWPAMQVANEKGWPAMKSS
jgi:hypothetical protein